MNAARLPCSHCGREFPTATMTTYTSENGRPASRFCRACYAIIHSRIPVHGTTPAPPRATADPFRRDSTGQEPQP